jgi:hypothetical protein
MGVSKKQTRLSSRLLKLSKSVTKEGAGMEKKGFEPKIIAFLCNWCSYGGADLAGVSRLQYPPNVRIVRVMCSGRVDPTFVFKALSDGADGVMVAG